MNVWKKEIKSLFMNITALWTNCRVVLEGVSGSVVRLTFNNPIEDSHHLQSLVPSCPLKVLTWMKFSFQIECHAADTRLSKQLWFFFFFSPQNKWLLCPLQCPQSYLCFGEWSHCPPLCDGVGSMTVRWKISWSYNTVYGCIWGDECTDKNTGGPWVPIEPYMLASSPVFSLVPPFWPQRPLNDLSPVGKWGLSFCFGWHLQQCTSAGLYFFFFYPKAVTYYILSVINPTELRCVLGPHEEFPSLTYSIPLCRNKPKPVVLTFLSQIWIKPLHYDP